jgi:short-subunit dehydrogenase
MSHISEKMIPMIDPANRVVVVTGASSGIGAALGKGFSRRGARVVLVARRFERLEAVAQNCAGEVLIVAADLITDTGRQSVVQNTMERWGTIDILVNNAGMGIYAHFSDCTESDWHRIFEINLFSAVFLTKLVLPIMQARKKGLVINMASIGGLIAHSDNVSPYVASKHALVGFSRGLSRDVADKGIRVMAVCPHLTQTEFFKTSPGADKMAPVVEKYKKFMDTPEDVACGILDQLDSDRLVVFPTRKPEMVYQKQRDL